MRSIKYIIEQSNNGGYNMESDMTLKEYFENRIINLEKLIMNEINHIDIQHTSIEANQHAALVEAKKDLERRLSGMNEFREQLQGQATTFLTKERFEVEKKSIDDIIRQIEL